MYLNYVTTREQIYMHLHICNILIHSTQLLAYYTDFSLLFFFHIALACFWTFYILREQ